MSSPAGYLAPVAPAEAEIRDRGSRFLARVVPACEPSSAERSLAEIRRRYRDATHHCWAWRLGHPANERSSDDGEPAGTAGRPILISLGELSDLLVVVVRWFGGTKLGKGGLARAYSGAARAALAGIDTVRRFPTTLLRLEVTYDQLGTLKRELDPPEIELVSETYGAGVALELRVAEHRVETLSQRLADRDIAPCSSHDG